jgi:hypothetical protein
MSSTIMYGTMVNSVNIINLIKAVKNRFQSNTAEAVSLFSNYLNIDNFYPCY